MTSCFFGYEVYVSNVFFRKGKRAIEAMTQRVISGIVNAVTFYYVGSDQTLQNITVKAITKYFVSKKKREGLRDYDRFWYFEDSDNNGDLRHVNEFLPHPPHFNTLWLKESSSDLVDWNFRGSEEKKGCTQG